MSRPTTRRRTITTARVGLLTAALLAVPASPTNPAGPAQPHAQAAAHSAEPLVSIPITRIADTREGVGAPDLMTDNETATITVTGNITAIAGRRKYGAVVVPPGADAVVLNMTAVGARTDGYFTAWPGGTAKPSTSNINFNAGKTVANSATIPLGADGTINVFSRGTADLLLDVSGYYADGTYTPAPARRLFDSRAEGGRVRAGSVTHVHTGAAPGDLITVNVATDSAHEPGYFSVWSTRPGEPTQLSHKPSTSTLNFRPGMIVANTAQVKVGDQGRISVYSMVDASLIVDLTHHIPAATADRVAVVFDTPVRTFDSRSTHADKPDDPFARRFWFGRSDMISNEGGVNIAERDAQAVIVNATITNTTRAGFATLAPYIDLQGSPATSTINFAQGETRANRIEVPLDLYGHISGFANHGADLVIDVIGYVPKSPRPAPPVRVDYSDAGPRRYFGAEEVDMTNRRHLQVFSDDPDGNGQRDWVLTGEDAELSHAEASNVVKTHVGHGPQVNGAPTMRVEFPGIPRDWAHQGRHLDGDHARPQYLLAELTVPMRNVHSGELAWLHVYVRGHFQGDAVSSRDLGADVPGSSVISAQPAAHTWVASPVRNKQVAISAPEQPIDVILPQSFVDQARGDILITSYGLPPEPKRSRYPQGVIGRDSDGNNLVTVRVPPPSQYNTEGLGQVRTYVPLVDVLIAATDAHGGRLELNLQVIRK